MVRRVGNICSKGEEMKNILVCEPLYRLVLDIASPLLETKVGNKNILVAINDYSKWCEAKVVLNHIVKIIWLLLWVSSYYKILPSYDSY
jgi:hypothetical protein